MQAPWVPPLLRQLLADQPSVGSLLELSSENYHALLRLAPSLTTLRGVQLSRVQGDLDLYLSVIEQTPYTTVVHVTYYFHHHEGQLPDPDMTLRVYHDARQVDIVALRQQVLPLERLFQAPGLQRKWKAQWFLAKWLNFCVRQGHHFPPPTAAAVCQQEPLETA